METNNYPHIRFFRYLQYKSTNGFVGYHIEDSDLVRNLGHHPLHMEELDDRQPLFLTHGESDDWDALMMLSPSQGQIFEINFEVTFDQIYIADDVDDYTSLLVFPVESPTGEDLCLYTPRCEDLIESGKRWFILTNEPNGENSSFLALPSETVSKIIPFSSSI